MEELKQEKFSKMCQQNPFIWAAANNLDIMEGVKFTLKNTPYLIDCIDFRTPENPKGKYDSLVVQKGAQSRLTTTMMLYVLHSLIYQKFDKNVMYFMPTFTTVKKANTMIFSPLLQNRCISPYVQDDNIDLKKVAGHSIVFVGATPNKIANTQEKDSANARSIPCDMILWDELDHIDDDIKEQGYERMLDSVIAIEAAWGSPTIPGYGVDHRYTNSTKDKWRIKCYSCGKTTCLIETFPSCIEKIGGKWTRVCIHCNKEIFVNDGKWVSEHPDRQIQGKFISGLMTPNAKLSRAMRIWNEGSERERVHMERSFLGRAVMQSGSQIQEYMVLEKCSDWYMPGGTKEETVCGVDVNDRLNVVIGQRIGDEMYKILWIGETEDFDELAVICHNFNVQTCFVDSMPDMHATKKFAEDMKFPVYRTTYSEYSQKMKLDMVNNNASVNRNELCDYVYTVFTKNMIQLPHEDQVVREYAKSLTKTAKTLVESPGTGIVKPKWVKLGDKADHYFHSTIYFLLACMESPISDSRHGHQTAVVKPRRFSGHEPLVSGGVVTSSRYQNAW